MRWGNFQKGKLSMVHAMKVTKQGKWHKEGNFGLVKFKIYILTHLNSLKDYYN